MRIFLNQHRNFVWKIVLFTFLLVLLLSSGTLSRNTDSRGLIVRIYPQVIEAGTQPKLRVGVFNSNGEHVEGAKVFLHGHHMATTQEDGLTPKEASWGKFGSPGVRKLTARKGNQIGVGYLGVVRGHPEINGQLIAESVPQVIESKGSPRVVVFSRSGEPISGAQIIHERAGPICTTRNDGITPPRDCGNFGSGSQGRVAALQVEKGNQTGVVDIMVAPPGEKVSSAADLTLQIIPQEVKADADPRMRVGVYDRAGEPVENAQVYLKGQKMAETGKNGLTPKDTDWSQITDIGIKTIIAKKDGSVGVALFKVITTRTTEEVKERMEGDYFLVTYPDGHREDGKKMLNWAQEVKRVVENQFPRAFQHVDFPVTIRLFLPSERKCSQANASYNPPEMRFALYSPCYESNHYYDRLYYIGNLGHEFGHILYKYSRRKNAGVSWQDSNAPEWFVEGFCEYVKMLTIGRSNFNRKYYTRYEKEAHNIVRNGFHKREDVYAAGSWTLRFLEDRYGDQVITNILNSSKKDFWKAFQEETGLTQYNFDDKLEDWLKERVL